MSQMIHPELILVPIRRFHFRRRHDPRIIYQNVQPVLRVHERLREKLDRFLVAQVHLFDLDL